MTKSLEADPEVISGLTNQLVAQHALFLRESLYFSIQYSPSVTVSLVPVLKSVVPKPVRVPRIPLNFPVPPANVFTLVKVLFLTHPDLP